jgi:hypothetical protein
MTSASVLASALSLVFTVLRVMPGGAQFGVVRGQSDDNRNDRRPGGGGGRGRTESLQWRYSAKTLPGAGQLLLQPSYVDARRGQSRPAVRPQ